MKRTLVLLSDTHGFHRDIRIPDGDILLHAGDLTRHGLVEELDDFNDFLRGLPHRHKVIVAGNHDFCFEQQPVQSRCRLSEAIYLEDSGVQLLGLSLYGSPWQPRFYDWAFNLPRGAALRAKWSLIPAHTDVLITHGPPLGIGDHINSGERVGCEELRAAVTVLGPRLHLFGHIHNGYGEYPVGGTHHVNASICDEWYIPRHAPLVWEVELAN